MPPDLPVSRRALIGAAAALWASACADEAARPVVRVAAAADLQFAIAEIARRFEAETGAVVRVALGSTGNLARQIRQGAPVHVFLAADERDLEPLAAAGIVEGPGVLYGLGRIVLLVAEGAPLRPDSALAGLREALGEGRIRRFAIANPAHAPYGARAQQALARAGLWAGIEPLLVYGENVAHAARFVLAGEADGGIVAWSLALAPAIAQQSRHALIPADWHTPLRQRMALVAGAPGAARAFFRHLQSAGARAVFARYGFALPPA